MKKSEIGEASRQDNIMAKIVIIRMGHLILSLLKKKKASINAKAIDPK